MKITAIKQQVNRADRYSIYIDEKYICSFSGSELLNHGLHVGQELTALELKSLKNDAVVDGAYYRSLDLIMRRARSEGELRDYLKRKEYPLEIIDGVVNKLAQSGYVDDADFARRWIENRRLLKSTNKLQLRKELKQKRVAEDVIDAALQDDVTDERQVLRDLVEKKRSRYPDKLKLMQYLARQGYRYDDIKTILEESAYDG
jgi:regulatory protein